MCRHPAGGAVRKVQPSLIKPYRHYQNVHNWVVNSLSIIDFTESRHTRSKEKHESRFLSPCLKVGEVADLSVSESFQKEGSTHEHVRTCKAK